jgi:hypothetical protein
LLAVLFSTGMMLLSWGEPSRRTKERAMKKLIGAVLTLVALLLAAGIIESGITDSTQVFQAIGTADGGGGGGGGGP